MKTNSLLLMGCLFLFLNSISAQNQFEIKISRDTVLLGNTCTVRFIATNLEGEFEGPDMTGIDVFSGPNISSSFQSINGETNSTTTYSYIIKPSQTGTFWIPPSFYIVDEKTFETEPYEIICLPNPQGIIQEDKQVFGDFEFPKIEFDFNFPFEEKPELQEKPVENGKRKLKKI